MKKVILSSLMAMFLFVGLTSMMSSSPPQNVYTGCHADCTIFATELGIFSSFGQCMSACNTCTTPQGGAYSGPGTAVGNIQVNHMICECHQIDDIIGFENTPFSNMGQCIDYLRDSHGI